MNLKIDISIGGRDDDVDDDMFEFDMDSNALFGSANNFNAASSVMGIAALYGDTLYLYST